MSEFKSADIAKYLTHEQYDKFMNIFTDLVDKHFYSQQEIDERMTNWCKDNCIDQYKLYLKYHSTAKELAKLELDDLTKKYDNMLNFAKTKSFFRLQYEQQRLFLKQHRFMLEYINTLKQRLEIWDEHVY